MRRTNPAPTLFGPFRSLRRARLRTSIAGLMGRHLHRPRPRVIQAWLWLASDTDDVEEKWRCLNAVLQLDPENEPTS